MAGNTNFQTFHQMGSAISNFVKQATGRENVQNIEMDHVTVAQNHVYDEVDVSGRVVQFSAGEAGLPFEKLFVQIEPVQDLHGYDHPWPAGGWKNLLKNTAQTVTKDGITFTVNDNGTVLVNGTATSNTELVLSANAVDVSGDYIVSGCPDGGDRKYWINFKQTVNGTGSWRQEYGSGFAVTGGTIQNVGVYISSGTTVNNALFKPMICLSSASNPTTFAPYSNICPITGWTMVNLYRAGQNLEDAQVFRFTFPSEAGIVYGGTLDVVTGELVVDRAMVTFDGTQAVGFAEGTSANRIAWNAYLTEGATGTGFISNLLKPSEPASSVKNDPWLIYNGNGVPRMFITVPKNIASVDDFNTYATQNNISVVYYLATPITYQLTPQEITTLLGQNNIWADTGDIEVKFTNLKELY